MRIKNDTPKIIKVCIYKEGYDEEEEIVQPGEKSSGFYHLDEDMDLASGRNEDIIYIRLAR